MEDKYEEDLKVLRKKTGGGKGIDQLVHLVVHSFDWIIVN